jgi:hypothetical protein
VVYGATAQELNAYALAPTACVVLLMLYFLGPTGWHGAATVVIGTVVFFKTRDMAREKQANTIRTFRKM